MIKIKTVPLTDFTLVTHPFYDVLLLLNAPNTKIFIHLHIHPTTTSYWIIMFYKYFITDSMLLINAK